LNAIFVNYAHPDALHVSGVRVPRFADALARRGHRIVLLTPTLRHDESGRGAGDLSRVIDAHGWQQPLSLAYRPVSRRSLDLLRSGRLPGPASKLVTLYHLLVHGGVHEDWVEASRPSWGAITARLRPDVVWTTFGHTSNLLLGKKLARLAGCKWVADIKDNLDVFVPRAVRPALRRRLSGCAAVTSNAHKHAQVAERFFRRPCVVVESGVSKELLATVAAPSDPDVFGVLLVGSVYRDDTCLEFLTAVGDWWRAQQGPTAPRVELHYAGADEARVLRLATVAGVDRLLKPHGYLPLDRLAAVGKAAAVNCYIWAGFGFHHKLLELLSLGVPVLAYAGESAESKTLAADLDGELHAPTTPGALTEAIGGIYARWRAGDRPSLSPRLGGLSWEAQAEKLEAVLEEAAGR